MSHEKRNVGLASRLMTEKREFRGDFHPSLRAIS